MQGQEDDGTRYRSGFRDFLATHILGTQDLGLGAVLGPIAAGLLGRTFAPAHPWVWALVAVLCLPALATGVRLCTRRLVDAWMITSVMAMSLAVLLLEKHPLAMGIFVLMPFAPGAYAVVHWVFDRGARLFGRGARQGARQKARTGKDP